MRYTIIVLTIFVLFSSFVPTEKENMSVVQKILWQQSDTSHNNYRIPSLIVTNNNTVLAFAEGREGGDSGDIDILLKRSADNGQTWSEQITVWDDAENTCGNPCPVVDRNTGRILLFMTWNLGSDIEHEIIRKTSKNTRLPYMCYSDDDGLTWSKPENLKESCKIDSWGWYATGPGVGIQLQSGKHKNRMVIPCNHSYDNSGSEKRDGFGYGAHVLFSDDGGQNWRISEPITPEVNESQVVELSNGTLLMNMRSYNEKHCRAIATSNDGGETWSDIEHDTQLVESVCQGSIINFGGYHEKQLFLFSNPSVPVNRSHMTAKTSLNNCKTWTNSKLIFEGPSAYSCLTKLPNGNIGLFFEAGDTSPYEKMVFVSFHPDLLFTPGSLIK